ncbi:hypothetical protein HAHE_08660 [Haloferula helveola]|uniref:Uncharacterized protein n=1 Tax=Haloferula helveola TaxID=490095 RepID=A0ABN6H4Y4_9BACT|nr:hypothetical protein HAHE_08660 [Haloferula helveola]
MMNDAPDHLGRFLVLAVLIGWPVAMLLAWWMRRVCSRRLDRLGEASSEEMLSELESEYAPRPAIRIRTQTEYLPFLVECIREQVDSGLDDDKVRCLQERAEGSKPNEERVATFTVETAGTTDTLSIAWTRDESDRIDLRIRAAPRIIKALREHKKKVPRAKPVTPAG